VKLSISETVKKAQAHYNIQDEYVMDFLHLIADNTLNHKQVRDAKNEMIRDLFREGFDCYSPDGTRKIGSKVIQQALWRVMSKIKFLEFSIHGTGKGEDIERLVSEGVRTVADRGDLTSCFRDKGGVFMNLFLYGDGFLFFGKGENKENPVSFRVLRNEDVYADNYAYGVRGVRPANRLAVIYSFSKREAYKLWPELEENNIFGRIPGTYQAEEDDFDRQEDDEIEVCWAWNKAEKVHQIFAGSQAYILETLEDEEYPCIKNNKPYIPVFQFLCQPSEGGFYNYGIGDMVADLAVITRKLLNMEVSHIEENVHPVTLLNAPQNKVDELVEKMSMAYEARANGLRPFVAMEYAQGGQQGVQSQSLLTQNLFNEWSAIWDRLYREISRLGINLDDIERGGGITRGQVIAEEQASNAFVLQTMEYNASETKELIECVMDSITEYVSKGNKTPLNLMTEIELDGQMARLGSEVTMGMLSQEIKTSNYFVTVDSRTGAIPSDLMKSIQYERLLQITPPGTPEFSAIYNRLSRIKGVDLRVGAPQPPTPAGALGQQAEGGNEVVPAPSQTQRVLPDFTGDQLTPV